ncbi:type IV toxin-antitoxin system AbiEi family antitoxin [Nocardia sp. NPDC051990]|uniref:type IV toxin-antitoxin system AbiEi family antitoxin n=1 Tax=Nocardia sp. NPDC051990 TaxID=3155285 RepID=UPI003440FEEB
MRPQDLADIYAQPRPEIARLVDRGVLHRVAHGYYIIVPPDITLTDRSARVRFVRRDTDALDAERIETSLGPALVTTPEQTVLDLARRPELGNADAEVRSAIETLYRRCDSARLAQLATDQRLGVALRRAESWGGV